MTKGLCLLTSKKCTRDNSQNSVSQRKQGAFIERTIHVHIQKTHYCTRDRHVPVHARFKVMHLCSNKGQTGMCLGREFSIMISKAYSKSPIKSSSES